MNWTSTVWRLSGAGERPARCLVGEREGRWQIVVWNDHRLVLWERHANGRDAWTRAEELRAALITHGWRLAAPAAPLHPGPEWRACPHCHQRPALVQPCGDAELGFLCTGCGHRWCAGVRIANRDRRAETRIEVDRRHPFHTF